MTKLKKPPPLLIFTNGEKAMAAAREAVMRKRVYARFVAEKKMTQLEADRGIAIMEAIAADYQQTAEQGSLAI